MTRINLIPPCELSRKHLVAEYRELPRIFRLVRAAQAKGLRPHDIDIPHTYDLGAGHMKFFYNKLHFLGVRYIALVHEMRARGFHVTFPSPNIGGIDPEWFGKYKPTPEAININLKRLRERGADGQQYGSQL
jgi:deoxyribonuclease (pyrimidine dimer)